MISVEEAKRLIAAQQRDFGTERIPLEAATDRILAEGVRADRDFPPFDRVTMDGIAIPTISWEGGQRRFRIAGVQPAGVAGMVLPDAGSCIEVMTGAVLPSGTDTVIPYEDCSMAGNEALVTVSSVRRGQNIHPRGSDSLGGDWLLHPYERITPAAAGTLAAIGKVEVLVQSLPRIAICSTGDELVAINARPEPHQIRRSNSYMLAVALADEGILADSFHLTDDPGQMKEALAGILSAYDALLFSGAVSKGKYDFLPEVLAELGMQTVFHRIAQRPGKPMLFGIFPGQAVVFGFPGNPASTLVCYSVYFLPWLGGCLHKARPVLNGVLSADVTFQPELHYHLPVTLSFRDGVLEASPFPGGNSGDMVSLQAADAVLTLPAGETYFKAGRVFPLSLLKSGFF